MKTTEDRFRTLFAQDRSNHELHDLQLMLIDVFENKEDFKYHPGDKFEVIFLRIGSC